MLASASEWRVLGFFGLHALATAVIVAGEFIEGRAPLGLAYGVALVWFAAQWWRLRTATDHRLTLEALDKLAFMVTGLVWFGMAPSRLSAIDAWFQRG